MWRFALVVLSLLALAGCGSDDVVVVDSSAGGLLALEPDPNGSELALATGTMSTDDRCVLLVEPDGRSTTLVWPAGRTRWIESNQTVEFTGLDGETVILRDGDRVELGGGGDSIEEDGIPSGAWLDRRDWVARPDDACVFDSRWTVGGVELLA